MEEATVMPLPADRGQQQLKAVQTPTWGEEETRELINIRVELEKEFTSAKRSRNLWGLVSIRLKELGFRRSPDQCKCKWKNLLNRFNGQETLDIENGRKFPFFDDLNRLFSEKVSKLQAAHIDSESPSASVRSKLKRTRGDQSSFEISSDGEENEDESEEGRIYKRNPQGRKIEKAVHNKSLKGKAGTQSSRTGGDDIHYLLEKFFHQQLMMEIQWKEMTEKHSHERLASEQEWKHSWVQHERERLLLERSWREREEQRREREESRAERRDALLTSLLNRLVRES